MHESKIAAGLPKPELYRQLAADLMKSERPSNLDAEELEQYDLLLEEQAFPFEEKAAEVHEVNARRTTEGIYDEWVRKSYAVLAQLQPARFGKQVEPEAFIAELTKPAPTGGPDGGSLTPPELTRSLAASGPPESAPAPAPAISPASQQQFADAVAKLEAADYAGARPVLEQLMAAEPSREPSSTRISSSCRCVCASTESIERTMVACAL